ncbi:MAG: 5-dehydro-2-deoxygluconokinase [Methylobacteriaceae bacterium]|nr:5-dehydro-2-deoxygluconokinase [Methylobacteriaceae bacterium]
MAAGRLDLIAIGRSSVDLYGQQVGGRLEDMASFSKAVGGSPTNTAIGAARLGLKAGVITRVGDEHFGRFIREQLEREGVDVEAVRTDPKRLTALAILGIRDDRSFPLVFYRTDCADAALDESDIDERHIARAGCVVLSGTHFARENSAAAQFKAMALMQRQGGRVAFDVDYRPNLWGLAGHGAGEQRYISSATVTAHLRPVLAGCDLIVGTEEELMIAAGVEEPLEACRVVRSVSAATIVMKRGPMGCVVFDGPIPDDVEQGIKGPGFPVEVYNVLGAGDAFMGGFLRGWLRDEPIETCCAWANACGAFAVSRLLCSVEYPTFAELQHFLKHGSPQRALRRDGELNHIHWATTRDRLRSIAPAPHLYAFAIDHRAPLEKMADEAGASRDRLSQLKSLAVDAAARVAQGRPGFGMLLDSGWGREALFKAEAAGLWLARPVEQPGARPFDVEGGGSLAARLVEWPRNHVVKALFFARPDDPPDLAARQDRELTRLFDACRSVGRELLVEIVAGKHGPLTETTTADMLARVYDLGVRPDWWKLEAQPSAAAWARIDAVIAARDPHCRGVVMLGLDAPEDDLVASFALTRNAASLRGFAVGRTIFSGPARDWLAGRIDDGQATARMADAFARLVAAWERR